jgi:hypothetical protein
VYCILQPSLRHGKRIFFPYLQSVFMCLFILLTVENVDKHLAHWGLDIILDDIESPVLEGVSCGEWQLRMFLSLLDVPEAENGHKTRSSPALSDLRAANEPGVDPTEELSEDGRGRSISLVLSATPLPDSPR